MREKYESLSLTILKDIAKNRGMKGVSALKKNELIERMLELDEKMPQYQFSKHKGYGTKLHYEMIEQYGVSPVHRRSFLKKILGENK